jgi:transposase
MHRFIDGEDRMQQALLPHSLEDYVDEENPVRVIEVFIDELDLAALGFSGMTPAATGRPAYHPSTLLKITSTATSTACSRAGGWNAKRSAISS